MVTWYKPAESVVSTVLTTSAATPPTVTVGEIIVAGDPLTTVPAGTGGLVAPKPVPHRTTRSPGLAATVPAMAAGSAMAA